jgi:hypothetical protein
MMAYFVIVACASTPPVQCCDEPCLVMSREAVRIGQLVDDIRIGVESGL